MLIRVKKLDSGAKLPAYAHASDAGMDFFANAEVTVAPGQIGRVPTGVAMEIPEGYVGLFWDKSGLSMTHGIKVLGGVIDAGYRGELVLGVINLGVETYTFEKGHKVMQLLIQPIVCAEITEVSELDDNTTRGASGFGSTGKM
jgi:dUTP pyrophosphatase